MKEGLNKEIIKRLYITEKNSTAKIAKMFGCTHITVCMRCRKYGIKLRPKSGTIEGLNKSVLQRLYIRDGKSLDEIANMFSCHPQTVRMYCKKYNIKTRGHREIKGLSKSLLHKLYAKEEKTTREIGKIIGCSYDVVRKRCREHGIPLRPTGSKRVDIDKSTLRRLYVQEGRSAAEIAKILGCSLSRVYKGAREIGS